MNAVAGGCDRPAAPNGIPFRMYADSLSVAPMHDNAKLTPNLDKAHDGLESTRWTTFGPMRTGYFVELAFDDAPEVSEIVLGARPSPADYPRRFTVEIQSPDGEWENIGSFDGRATTDGVTTVKFDRPRRARLLVIRIIEDDNFWWSIHELSVR